MALSRREFVGSLLAGGALAALPGHGRFALAGETSAADTTLVVVFLRGGADGLALVGPAADPVYTADRPPELRVLDTGDRQGHRLDRALDPRLDFRLHPDAGPLDELYQAGQLAILHATGLEDGTRSHFVAQDLMEHGIALEPDIPRTGTGWLARLLAAMPGHAGAAGLVRAACTQGAVDVSLRGFAPALAIPDLGGGVDVYGGEPTRQALDLLYRSGDDPLARSMRAAVATITGLDRRLPRGPDRKPLPYLPENGAAYEGNDLGRGLRTVAQLLKLEVGLTLAAVDMGGWDTHEGQPGRVANQVRQLSHELTQFWNDVSRYHDQLNVVVMTEFGRRLRSNLSQGTDHGHGAVMLVLGGRINGGRMYGRWPGLAAQALDHGVDLAVTTDYRRVLGEVVEQQFAASAAAVFPGLPPAPPLGLLRA